MHEIEVTPIEETGNWLVTSLEDGQSFELDGTTLEPTSYWFVGYEQLKDLQRSLSK